MINTWLPLPSYKDSIATLTDDHLGLQRIHVLEIMETFHEVEVTQLPVTYETHDLVSAEHPILDMWRGYELQLVEYGLVCCEEWTARKGRRDPVYEKLSRHMGWATTEDASFAKPNWFGEVEFHLSHQAALIRADKQHYSKHFMDDGDRHMIWPESDRHAS